MFVNAKFKDVLSLIKDENNSLAWPVDKTSILSLKFKLSLLWLPHIWPIKQVWMSACQFWWITDKIRHSLPKFNIGRIAEGVSEAFPTSTSEIAHRQFMFSWGWIYHHSPLPCLNFCFLIICDEVQHKILKELSIPCKVHICTHYVPLYHMPLIL